MYKLMSSLIDCSKIENDDALRYSSELELIMSEPVLANRFRAECCSPPASFSIPLIEQYLPNVVFPSAEEKVSCTNFLLALWR